jgi:membrane protease YdiL (CAAX protease family)
MVVLFLVPPALFVAATFGATAVMLAAAAFVGGVPRPRPTRRALMVGLGSAVLLYAVFYVGNVAVKAVGFPGTSSGTGASIYSLIASPSNPLPLQVCVLAFDAAGFESFFRGALQTRLQARLGAGAAAATALVDAGLHLVTLNPLWVATTFVADLVWGLTYIAGRDLTASATSHFLWDVAIFILRPIR